MKIYSKKKFEALHFDLLKRRKNQQKRLFLWSAGTILSRFLVQLEVTTSNEACKNGVRLATEPLTFTCQWHSPDILKRCEGAEKEFWRRKSFLQRAYAHLLVISNGFCNCNAAAFHNNGINIVAVLETAEYRIIRF